MNGAAGRPGARAASKLGVRFDGTTLRDMASTGCPSVDGNGASRWRGKRLPQYVAWAAQPPQLRLTS